MAGRWRHEGGIQLCWPIGEEIQVIGFNMAGAEIIQQARKSLYAYGKECILLWRTSLRTAVSTPGKQGDSAIAPDVQRGTQMHNRSGSVRSMRNKRTLGAHPGTWWCVLPDPLSRHLLDQWLWPCPADVCAHPACAFHGLSKQRFLATWRTGS